jgi:GTP 3',8-cyclase
MPEEGIQLRDKDEFMRQEELFSIVDSFVDLGIKKIRLTGGEPLIKKNIAPILSYFGKLNLELSITTNGILLDKYWKELQEAGIANLNISIDSLDKEKFNSITRRKYFDRVYQNIFTAIEKGFNVKLNVVLLKNINDVEILDFIELTKEHSISVRFIEFMPFDGNNWDWSKTVSYQHILSQATFQYTDKLTPLQMEENGTSRDFYILGYKGTFGVISSITNPFCGGCNRIRLTADGKIKNCLFSEEETDLLSSLRSGQNIIPLIQSSIMSKHKERANLKPFDDKDFSSKNRSMVSIGG